MKRIIKIIFRGLGLVILAGLLFLGMLWIKSRHIVNAEPHPMPGAARPLRPLIGEVNPFIGTGGYPWVCGHNFPGATLPFGMVRLSPETASFLTGKRARNTSGYYYGDNKIIGFSHTRLSGTGATDGGHFLVVPATGPLSQNNPITGRGYRFSHRDEVAFPGYYAVSVASGRYFCGIDSHRTGWNSPLYFSQRGRSPYLCECQQCAGGCPEQ